MTQTHLKKLIKEAKEAIAKRKLISEYYADMLDNSEDEQQKKGIEVAENKNLQGKVADEQWLAFLETKVK